jgi:hypothetical protein
VTASESELPNATPRAISYADAASCDTGLSPRGRDCENESHMKHLRSCTEASLLQSLRAYTRAVLQWVSRSIGWPPSHAPRRSVANVTTISKVVRLKNVPRPELGVGKEGGTGDHEHGGHESHSAVPARMATTRKDSEKWPLNWTAPLKADAVEHECDRRSMADGGLRPELAPLGCNAGQVTSGAHRVIPKQRWCNRSR